MEIVCGDCVWRLDMEIGLTNTLVVRDSVCLCVCVLCVVCCVLCIVRMAREVVHMLRMAHKAEGSTLKGGFSGNSYPVPFSRQAKASECTREASLKIFFSVFVIDQFLKIVFF